MHCTAWTGLIHGKPHHCGKQLLLPVRAVLPASLLPQNYPERPWKMSFQTLVRVLEKASCAILIAERSALEKT